MNKVVYFIRWVCSDLFNLTIATLILLYLWWFRLNPFVFGPGEQASDPLIFGLVLLLIYIFIVGVMKFSRQGSFVRALSYVLAVLLSAINTLFMFFYLPRLQASARFGNTTYYITSNSPFLECCGYHQFTDWQGIHYESDFFAYSLPSLKFIYDEKSSEVSVVKIYEDSEQLYVTLGQPRRYYEGYAQFRNQLYYGSMKCNRRQAYSCESWTYSLYQCALDNTSCTKLPVEYTGSEGWINLQANELTDEIQFYIEFEISPDPGTLIYTYGQHPRCIVEGCSINE
jgi:hypothetical protein